MAQPEGADAGGMGMEGACQALRGLAAGLLADKKAGARGPTVAAALAIMDVSRRNRLLCEKSEAVRVAVKAGPQGRVLIKALALIFCFWAGLGLLHGREASEGLLVVNAGADVESRCGRQPWRPRPSSTTRAWRCRTCCTRSSTTPTRSGLAGITGPLRMHPVHAGMRKDVSLTRLVACCNASVDLR